MKLRFHQSIRQSSLRFIGLPLQHSWRHSIIVYLLLLFAMASSEGTPVTDQRNTIPNSLPGNTGYHCYLRCLAKCVDELGASSLHSRCSSKCISYNRDNLCNKTEKTCWSSCRDLITGNDSSPAQPINVTASYVRFPQPSPYEADIRWSHDDDASLYIIQYVDATDSFQTWLPQGGAESTLTVHNHWLFLKPNLCPEYEFRVAAINRYGVSVFSKIASLPKPIPTVPTPFYDLVSVELLNQSFPSTPDMDYSGESFNQTVRALVSFAPPPGWNLSTDILDITAELYPEQSGNQVIGYSPEKRWIEGTALFEVTLPGSDDEQWFYKLMFSVQKIITRCDNVDDPDRSNSGFDYPSSVYNPARHMMLPVFEFELSCKNVPNTDCPYDARDALPSCAVNSMDVVTSYDNVTLLFQANVTFDYLLERRKQPLLHYLITYGDGQDPPVDERELMPPTMTDIVKQIRIPNTSQEFQLDGLHSGKLYVVYICGIYANDSESVDWNLTSRYVIDLTDWVEEEEPALDQGGSDSITLLVAAPIVALLTIFIAVFVIIMGRRRRQRKARNCNDPFSSAAALSNQYVEQPRRFDKWEIPRRMLIVHADEKLGSGAFGAVYKGRVTGELLAATNQRQCAAEKMQLEKCVAVKVVPEYADEKSKSDFRSEINIMKQLGHHERLVNMVACITADDPLCLIVEYCAHGDLLRYMRVRKTYMMDLERIGIDLNNLGPSDEVDQGMILSMKDVFSFAWQISVGLEYISQKGFIHRDVAARNVLMADGKRVKIGDFGLCRYVSHGPIYAGRGGRLPLKWMALEALKSYQFTTKSDVWSFGVLLYELFTLGYTPYPGLDPADVERFLDNGNRMSQPSQCPLELYSIMLSCWQECPDSRPSFTELRQLILVLLENAAGDYYYTQVRSSSAVENGRTSSKYQEKKDVWPQVDDCDLDDHVFMDDHLFEDETGATPSASHVVPPPRPPRPRRTSLSNAAVDLATNPWSRSSFSGPVARYTRSTDLTMVMEADNSGGSSEDNIGLPVHHTITPTSSEHTRVRRRSSVRNNCAE